MFWFVLFLIIVAFGLGIACAFLLAIRRPGVFNWLKGRVEARLASK